MTEQHNTFIDRSCNDKCDHSISNVLTSSDGSCKRRRQRPSSISLTSPTKLQGILSNRRMTQRHFRLTTTTTTNIHQTHHQLLPRLLCATPIAATNSTLLFLLLLSLQLQSYIGHVEAFIPLRSTTTRTSSYCTGSRCISGTDSRVRTARYYIHHNHYPHENGSSSSTGSNNVAAATTTTTTTTTSPIHDNLSSTSSSSKGTLIKAAAAVTNGASINNTKKKKTIKAVKRSSKTGSRIIESIEEYIAIMTSSSSLNQQQQQQHANGDNDDLNSSSNSHSTTTTGRNKPILLYWTAPWCGPCRLSQPIIQDINRMYTSNNPNSGDNEDEDIVVTYEINTDEFEDLANAVGITSIPTIQIYEPLVLDDNNNESDTNNHNKNTNPRRKLHDTFVGCVGTKQVLISSIEKLLEDIEKKKKQLQSSLAKRKASFPTSSSSTGATIATSTMIATTATTETPLIC